MSESGKVVVTKSKLDGLANAINDKAKSPGPKTIAQLTQTVNDIKTDAPVTSVNGKTGAVTLSATDVSAIPSTLTGTAGQVLTKTANGQEWKDAASPQPSTTTPLAPTETGSVGASTAYARGDHVHPKQEVTKSDVGLGNVDNVSINTRMNRTTNVNAPDSNYTTYMARGEALFSAETTPTVNGCIAWVYG